MGTRAGWTLLGSRGPITSHSVALLPPTCRPGGTVSLHMTNLLTREAGPFLAGVLARLLLPRDLENLSLIGPFCLHEFFDDLQRRLPLAREVSIHGHITLNYVFAGQKIQERADCRRMI